MTVRTTILTLAATGAVFVASPALAQVTYLTQTRTIHAEKAQTHELDPFQSYSEAAPNFGPFSASTELVGAGLARASQVSMLTPSGIHVEQEAFGRDINAYNTYGRSVLDITFSVDIASPYQLLGTMGRGTGSALVRLSQGAIILYESDMFSTYLIDVSGTLQPGTYRFETIVDNGNTLNHTELHGTITADLNVPSPTGIALGGCLAAVVGIRRRR